MADFLTHDLFGKTVEKHAPLAVKELAAQYQEAFRWGFQGPDILFFRSLWKEGGPYHHAANRMHSEFTDELFSAMTEHIRRQESGKKEVMLAYFYGFLCHYALDSAIHPYVYALQRKGEAKNPDASPGTLHCQIETDIDMALCDRWEGKSATEFHPYDGHHLPTGQQWIIGDLYETVLLEVYGEVVPAEETAHSFADTLLVEDLLYRQGKNLGKAAFAMGLVKPKWSDFVSHAKISLPSWDALNLKKRGWRSPDQPEILRKDSVLEILEQAEGRAVELMEAYARMFDGQEWGALHFPVSFDNGNHNSKKQEG